MAAVLLAAEGRLVAMPLVAVLLVAATRLVAMQLAATLMPALLLPAATPVAAVPLARDGPQAGARSPAAEAAVHRLGCSWLSL